MRLLVAKGLSAEDLLEVAETMAVPEKRSAGAERQARYRARQKAQSVTGDVTGDGNSDATDVTSPALSPFPNENNSNPNPHTHPEKTPRARKGHRLPVDWQPAPLPASLAADVAAWPSGALERELARFRDWAASATGPNAIKTDWDAAWRNWLRKAHDEGRWKQNGNGIRQGGSSGPDKRSGLARAIDSELQRVSAFP